MSIVKLYSAHPSGIPGYVCGAARYVFTGRNYPACRGIYGGFNLALHVDDNPDDVLYNRSLLLADLALPKDALCTLRQVHGDNVLVVSADILNPTACASASGLADADAMITSVPHLPLAVFTADCVPIAILDPAGRGVSAVHAGWRGTAAGIAAKTAHLMSRLCNCPAADLHALIGPSIGPCCYRFNIDMLRCGTYLQAAHFVNTADGAPSFDLWQANRDQLIKAGLKKENISISGICTACNVNEYFSYRAENGETGRQALAVWIEG